MLLVIPIFRFLAPFARVLVAAPAMLAILGAVLRVLPVPAQAKGRRAPAPEVNGSGTHLIVRDEGENQADGSRLTIILRVYK